VDGQFPLNLIIEIGANEDHNEDGNERKGDLREILKA